MARKEEQRAKVGEGVSGRESRERRGEYKEGGGDGGGREVEDAEEDFNRTQGLK